MWLREALFAIAAVLCAAAVYQNFEATAAERKGSRRTLLAHKVLPDQPEYPSEEMTPTASELSKNAPKKQKTATGGRKAVNQQCNPCSDVACAAERRSTVWRACCRGGKEFQGSH
eukprot:1570416-Rhodomonas_salina.1